MLTFNWLTLGLYELRGVLRPILALPRLADCRKEWTSQVPSIADTAGSFILPSCAKTISSPSTYQPLLWYIGVITSWYKHCQPIVSIINIYEFTSYSSNTFFWFLFYCAKTLAGMLCVWEIMQVVLLLKVIDPALHLKLIRKNIKR